MCLQLISNYFIFLMVLLNRKRNMRKQDFSFRAITIFNWLTAYHLFFIKTRRFGVPDFPIPALAWDFSYKNVLKFNLAKIGTTIFYSILVHPLSMQDMICTFFSISDFSLTKVIKAAFSHLRKPEPLWHFVSDSFFFMTINTKWDH